MARMATYFLASFAMSFLFIANGCAANAHEYKKFMGLTDSVRALIYRAQKLETSGDYRGAIQLLQQSESIKDKNSNDVYFLNSLSLNCAISLRDNEIIEKSIENILSTGLSSPEETVKYRRALAQLAANRQDFSKAAAENARANAAQLSLSPVQSQADRQAELHAQRMAMLRAEERRRERRQEREEEELERAEDARARREEREAQQALMQAGIRAHNARVDAANAASQERARAQEAQQQRAMDAYNAANRPSGTYKPRTGCVRTTEADCGIDGLGGIEPRP